jgi:hypothetical protein
MLQTGDRNKQTGHAQVAVSVFLNPRSFPRSISNTCKSSGFFSSDGKWPGISPSNRNVFAIISINFTSCSLSMTTNSLFLNACMSSSNSAWICSIADSLCLDNACLYLVTHDSRSLRNLAVFCLFSVGIFVILSKNLTPLRNSSIIFTLASDHLRACEPTIR